MSSVASSNASDAASTTGSANSADSGASSVASATSGASKASTAPSSVKSADSGTGSADDKSTQALKEWYNKQINVAANKPKFNGWLRASRNSDPTTATVMGPLTTVDDFFDDERPGVYETTEGRRIMRFAPQGEPSGQQVIRIGNDEFTCTWVPAAPGAGSSLHYVGATESPTMGTATETGKTMPSLAPFLKLPEPTIPPPPETFKSYNPKNMKMARPMGIGDWDSYYSVMERYKGAEFDQQQCYALDGTDLDMLEALKEAKINERTATNFPLLEKASHYMPTVSKVPSAMASLALGIYKKKLSEDENNRLEVALKKRFTQRLSHPPDLPVTRDGLSTYLWASTFMHGGELKGVDATTALGRQMMMRQVRADIFNQTEASYNDITDAACTVVDWIHGDPNYNNNKRHAMDDLMDFAITSVKAGRKLPKHCPQSILDMGIARDEANKATRSSSPKSTTPSGLASLAGPLPPEIPAHQAQTSGQDTFKRNTRSGTEASLPDSLRSRLAGLPKKISKEGVQTLNKFFKKFEPKRV